MSNLIDIFLNNIRPLRLPPASCLLCGSGQHNAAICPDCLAALPWLSSTCCPCCALPTLDGGLCGDCLQSPPVFTSTVATFAYTGILAELIQAAKFGGRWSILPILAPHLLPRISQHPDLIVPMPLHRNRLRERGFNQAQEIAKPLAQALHIPLATQALQRIRDTEHQARLNGTARLTNMKQAFVAKANVAGKRIALVDDVLTTGASLNAASIALRQAGASDVECWVLARTLGH